ncbi:MAG TPA: hypothetical protein VMV90_16050 [Rectinemataceae bacterium]|nr:hypothetical protein [Rectinemataceae bacterium]
MSERSFAFGVSAVAALCSVSCGAGLLSDMGRSLEDPRLAAPSVASFADEHRIEVSWAADANADLCVLERAPDAAVPSWETIYRGIGTRYADTKCSDQGRYLYRLTELRGERSFGPSEAVPGVASATCRDALEPDDEESEATPLASTLAANLFYYSFAFRPNGLPIIVQDLDWYAVTVPPNRTANLVVTQLSPALAGGSTSTWMYLYRKGMNPQQIVNNQAIPFTNYSNAAATFLFKIYPVPANFPADGGGAVVDYTVSLDSITN